MFFLLWDASALAQRYAPEIGHQTVNPLFTAVSQAQMITTVLSYSETCGTRVYLLTIKTFPSPWRDES